MDANNDRELFKDGDLHACPTNLSVALLEAFRAGFTPETLRQQLSIVFGLKIEKIEPVLMIYEEGKPAPKLLKLDWYYLMGRK